MGIWWICPPKLTLSRGKDVPKNAENQKGSVAMAKEKNILEGWVYDDEDYNFHSISAWNDSPLGIYCCILKHKKDLGQFKGHKVRITIEEIGGKEAKNPQLKTEGGK
jgi:hypothetical protein